MAKEGRWEDGGWKVWHDDFNPIKKKIKLSKNHDYFFSNFGDPSPSTPLFGKRWVGLELELERERGARPRAALVFALTFFCSFYKGPFQKLKVQIHLVLSLLGSFPLPLRNLEI